jgi:hypothetical protein
VRGVSLHIDLGGGHPLLGRSTPDLALADGRRFGRLQSAGAVGSSMSLMT